MSETLRIPLDLPDVRTLGMSTTPRGEFILKVENTLKGTTCRQCGRYIEAGYGRDRPLRHLPILDRPVYIEICPRRYRCPYCDDHPTTAQRLAWYGPNSPHTKAYEKTLLRELSNSTIADVSRKQDVTEDEVLGIIDRHLAREVDWERFERLEVLGLDEIAVRKRQHDLDPDKDATLFKLFEHSPALHQAYILRESLTWVFDLAHSKIQGRQAILRWCEQVRASGLDCLDAFLGTVDKWLDEITNYFIHGDTSGFVEGLNNKIKVIKRRCYGILNLDHLFQRLDLQGYRLLGLA